SQWHDFFEWLAKQQYRKKIIIGGNHDNFLLHANAAKIAKKFVGLDGYDFEYLYDSGTIFEGLKIWGSPWSLFFENINPKCMAFTGNEKYLKRKYDLIPYDIDILITHQPPYGILDGITIDDGSRFHTGSHELLGAMLQIKPKLMVFGHIHEWGGNKIDLTSTICVNASIVNEYYQPVNKPVRVIL
ncbi:MAG: metallophosphoesterase family protein, partial [Rhodanobacter sp.]